MTEEQRQLLIKDLCGRLPYGVIVQSRIIDFYTEESAYDHSPNHVKHPSYVGNGRLILMDTLSNSVCIRPILKNLTYREQVFFEDICKNGYIPVDECRPYLFPLSSMTPKQKAELAMLVIDVEDIFKSFLMEVEFYRKHHFDYRGLIEQGLAIDATGLRIYNKEG